MSQEAKDWLIILSWLLVFAALVAFFGCAEQQYPRGDLAHQILHVRTGAGLSSRISCVECTEPATVRYDLADQGIRTQLEELGFVCKLGGRRFEVCPDRPGFCRYHYDGFWPFRDRVTEYVAITEELRLIQAHTVCFSKRYYDYDSVQ